MPSRSPWRSRTVVTPQARYRGSAQGATCAWASISPGMIQRRATSTSTVRLGSVNPARGPIDSIRPRRTTTTASGSGGPPLPSISVAPTSATPSAGARAQLTPGPSASTSNTVVDDSRMREGERIQQGGRVIRALARSGGGLVILGR